MIKEPKKEREKYLGEVVHRQLEEKEPQEAIPRERFTYMKKLVRKILRKD